MVAANKECDCVKSKLKHLESDLNAMRNKLSEREDELDTRYTELEKRQTELKNKSDQMQSLAISLQVQLAEAHVEVSELRSEKERLVKEREIEKRALQEALDAAIIERAEHEVKWQKEFEQLRTHHSGRESLSVGSIGSTEAHSSQIERSS